MTNPQGTIWESDLVNRAQSEGRLAGRHPKRAQKGEPDLWIAASTPLSRHRDEPIAIVAWKRLVGAKKDGRRKPDGERMVIVMSATDFFERVLPYVPYAFEVQAKWTSALNVTRVLGELKTWLKGNR